MFRRKDKHTKTTGKIVTKDAKVGALTGVKVAGITASSAGLVAGAQAAAAGASFTAIETAAAAAALEILLGPIAWIITGVMLVGTIAVGYYKRVKNRKVLTEFKKFTKKFEGKTNVSMNDGNYMVTENKTPELTTYAVKKNDELLFKWSVLNKEIVLFDYKRVEIFVVTKGGVYCNAIIDLKKAPSVRNNSIIIPPLWEQNLDAMRNNTRNLHRSINEKKKRAMKKIKRMNKVVSAIKVKKGEVSNPAFDPFPFATQIKQKDHKIYKNLRY